MSVHSFSPEDNKKFWTSNLSSYHGEKNARWLIFLTREFIGSTILDAGAGDGSLVSELEKRIKYSKVTGIDLAPKREDLDSGNLMDLPYPDESFDTVFCSEVLEHVSIDDACKILLELNRVLKKDGHVIVTTPYAERLEESLVSCPKCECSFHRYGHQLSLVEEDIDGLFQESNFETKLVFPVKMSRVRRYSFIGARFFRSAMMTSNSKNTHGKRTLIAIAKKKH